MILSEQPCENVKTVKNPYENPYNWHHSKTSEKSKNHWLSFIPHFFILYYLFEKGVLSFNDRWL